MACARTRSPEYAADGRHADHAPVPPERRIRIRRRIADPGPAEHRRRLVHAGDRRVAGRPRIDQQHVPHQRPALRRTGPPRSTRASCRPRRSPSRPSAPASRSPRSSGPAAATRRSRARRSTSARSSRVAASRPTSSAPPATTCSTTPPSSRSFGLQFDHPAGYAGQAPVRRRRAAPGDRLDERAGIEQPAMEMRLRVLDFGTDKYGLNAYIYDSTDDGTVNYDRVLFSPVQGRQRERRRPRRGRVGRRQGQDHRWCPRRPHRRLLVKVETLSPDLERVRLFHTSVTRAIASWPTWPGAAGFTGTSTSSSRSGSRRSTAADFAVLEAGVVERGDVRRAGPVLGDRPLADPRVRGQDLQARPAARRLSRRPTSSSTSSSGSSARGCGNGARNPAYDDVELDGVRDGRVRAARGVHPRGVQGVRPDAALARRLMGNNPTTFVGVRPRLRAAVPGDRRQQGAGRPRPALAPADVELPAERRPRPSARPRPAGPAAPSRSTSTWPGATRSTRRSRRWQPPTRRPPSPRSRPSSSGLSDPNDWTHDGRPERWKVIDRAFTKAEARYIPNGPGSTTDMAHPTRTGDLVVFSAPPYQFDAATPGTLIAPSHFFGQHGYVPDVQDLRHDINMRATFLAGGARHRQALRQRADHRPRADARLPARRPGAPAQPGPGADRDRQGRVEHQARLDHRAQRLPRPARSRRR